MPPIESLIPFALAAFLLALVPGPDNIFVVTQSMLHGCRAGLSVVFGLCTGLIGHTLAVTCGLAVLLQTTSWALTLLKCVGASYLIFLAWQEFQSNHSAQNLTDRDHLSLIQYYQRGVIMNLSNPKVTLFFLAFLPQFVQPDHGPVWQQMLILSGLFLITTVVVFGSLAILAEKLGNLMLKSESGSWISILHVLVGCLYLGLALKLLFDVEF